MNFIDHLTNHFGKYSEKNSHAHCPQEKAELFRTADGGSTEYEILNLLNSLICCYKPSLCLETGTYRGYGTMSIAHGLKQNKLGKLITIDQSIDFLQEAKNKVLEFDKNLEPLIQYCQANSLEWLNNYQGDPFDFIFFDSDISCRKDEFKILARRNLIKPGCVCFFHDTSPTRWLTFTADSDYVLFTNKLLEMYEGFSSSYSKGFVVVRISPNLIFDEKYYLEQHPDVAKFIKNGGPLKTGYDHYLAYGYVENRKFKWSLYE